MPVNFSYVYPVRSFWLTPIFLMLGLASLCGCAGAPTNRANLTHSPGVLVIALDRNAGDSVYRETELRNVNSLVKSAAEAGYPLEMWAYDSSPTRIFGPAIPESEDDTFQLEADQVRKASTSKPAELSRPALLLEAIASDKALAGFQAARIMVLGHGESPESDQNLMMSSGGLLAKKPGWRIAVVGVDRTNIHAWQSALGPSFGTRLDIAESGQTDTLLRQNRDE